MVHRSLVRIAVLSLLIPAYGYAEEHTFDSDGVTIHYTVEGEGEPVLLIHGYTATGTLNWRTPGVVRLLADNYRVIVPDVRNHGRSDVVPEGEHGIEVVEDMRRLLDHLEIDRAHLVGYSMGGMITIKFLTRYPERVRTAVIGGMGWLPAGSESARNYATSTANSERLQASLRGFGDFATTAEEMQAIDVPIHVIIGTDDDLTRRVDRWKEIVPALSVEYVDGATHMGTVFRPEFREGIRAFLDAQTQGVQVAD